MAFTIKSRLGRGKTVESFAATLEVDGDRFDVVVKRPRAEFKQNTAFADAFMAWGEGQREVEHENVVAVLEVGRTDEGAYVLQEAVDGAPLSKLIAMLRKRKRTLMPSLAIAISEQLAAGLAHLHHKKIVHGGLDSGEVIVGYGGEVKFGDQRLHGIDHHLGTDLVSEKDPYRSPDGSTPTEAGDVWALGLITLEMLIGSAVWTSESMTVAGSVAALKDFTHVGQAQPLLTEDIVEILEACLAESPGERTPAVKVFEKIKALIAKHGIREERSALGEFVKALIPPPEADAAPTQMVDPERAAQIAAQHSARLAHFDLKSVPLDPDLEKKALTRAGRPPAPPAPNVPDVAKVAARAASEFDRSAGRNVKLAVIAISLLVMILSSLVLFGGKDAHKIRLRASSVPAGANVFVDGHPIGATPVDEEIDVAESTVKLRFTLDGYKEHQVTIGTDATELRYEAPLEPK